MEQVVRQMQLNIVYSQRKNFVKREIYRSPFRINIIKGIDTLRSTEIKIENLNANNLQVSYGDNKKRVGFNNSFIIPGIGVVSIMRDASVEVNSNEEFIVDITSIDQKVSTLMQSLSIGVSNKQVSIIELDLIHGLPKKGEDILNTLISRYISSGLDDKNAVADSTEKFIRERLSVIASELGDVENSVQTFKQGNSLADMSEQGKLLVQNSSEFASELSKAQTQVTILNDLENYLKDENKNRRVFPTSLLPQDMVFSGLMNQYNALLVERDKQLLSVTETSPFVQNIDSQISGLRAGILANIQSTKNTFVITRDNLQKELDKAQNKISGVPKVEKDYLKLARNQQIKQELYIFLMQKAEETAISKTSNISIAKIIDPPKSQLAAVSPRKTIIMMIALLVGLAIPLGYSVLTHLLNTTIMTKEDVNGNTTVPIIGEISHNTFADNLIVANKGRSAISEQFRALRTNLTFYLKSEDNKIILLTSSTSGEGKSFTAINLGNILALTGKKVLLMELDLRKPGLSTKLGVSSDVGFSNSTLNPNLELKTIIKPLSINENLFLMSSGPLPPNPAETLMADSIPKLIESLKQEFDYIIMDAPPIGIIADAQILAQYADVTLYLVRQKVTKKADLNIVDDLYRSKKIRNLGIVVNDIDNKFYGYGYGYGNYGQSEEKVTGLKKILNKLKFIK